MCSQGGDGIAEEVGETELFGRTVSMLARAGSATCGLAVGGPLQLREFREVVGRLVQVRTLADRCTFRV